MQLSSKCNAETFYMRNRQRLQYGGEQIHGWCGVGGRDVPSVKCTVPVKLISKDGKEAIRTYE